MGVPPAKLHEKLGAIGGPASLVGRTPWSAADAPVGLLAPRKMPMSLCRLRDEGVPRGPGGPPHHAGGFSTLSQGVPKLVVSAKTVTHRAPFRRSGSARRRRG